MNYAEIKPVDIANGPGVRVSIFVSGCEHHCKGCFNSVAWDFDYGKPFTDEVMDYIIDLLKPDYIKGITFLGGEPMHPNNQYDVAKLIYKIRKVYGDTKSIWLFTGYVLGGNIIDACKCKCCISFEFILNNIDVLVDGPFIEEKKNLSLRFRGSENQRIIDMKKTLYYNKICLWTD